MSFNVGASSPAANTEKSLSMFAVRASSNGSRGFLKGHMELFFPIFLRDRNAAAHAEGFGGYFQARSGLAAFVFAEINQANHSSHGSFVKSSGDDVGGGFAVHDVQIQNG